MLRITLLTDPDKFRRNLMSTLRDTQKVTGVPFTDIRPDVPVATLRIDCLPSSLLTNRP